MSNKEIIVIDDDTPTPFSRILEDEIDFSKYLNFNSVGLVPSQLKLSDKSNQHYFNEYQSSVRKKSKQNQENEMKYKKKISKMGKKIEIFEKKDEIWRKEKEILIKENQELRKLLSKTNCTLSTNEDKANIPSKMLTKFPIAEFKKNQNDLDNRNKKRRITSKESSNSNPDSSKYFYKQVCAVLKKERKLLEDEKVLNNSTLLDTNADDDNSFLLEEGFQIRAPLLVLVPNSMIYIIITDLGEDGGKSLLEGYVLGENFPFELDSSYSSNRSSKCKEFMNLSDYDRDIIIHHWLTYLFDHLPNQCKFSSWENCLAICLGKYPEYSSLKEEKLENSVIFAKGRGEMFFKHFIEDHVELVKLSSKDVDKAQDILEKNSIFKNLFTVETIKKFL